MADMLTHALTGYLLAGRRTSSAAVVWLVSGGILPDILDRAPNLIWRRGLNILRVAPAEWQVQLLLGLELFHTPVGLGLLAATCACIAPDSLCVPVKRHQAGMLLWLGGMSHLAWDMCQRGARIKLLYPVSMDFVGNGFTGSEASFWAWIVLIPASLMLARTRRARTRPSARGEAPAGEA